MSLREELERVVKDASHEKYTGQDARSVAFLRDHGQALVEALQDSDRLDWVARYGVSFRIESRNVETMERRNAKWWIDCQHHTHIRAVDERVRFDSYRQAIDIARSKTADQAIDAAIKGGG